MTTIGTFTKQENGFIGNVRTLTVNVKVKLVLTEKTHDKAPDYRILAGNFEIGAAWKKTSQTSERDYLSVTLDDPSFPSKLNANLVESEDGTEHYLIWSRKQND